MTAALSDLATLVPRAQLHGGDAEVVDVTHDSRQVESGWLFCCVPGTRVDGHDHARQAVDRGAAGLLVERWLDLGIPQMRVPSVRAAMGPLAARVHGDPSRDLCVIGVTGTNGKTTVTYLLESAFGAAAVGTGVVGTIATRIHGEALPGVRTTPEGPDLQRLLRQMYARGVDAVAMEVSSHGLDLRRVDGTRFAVALFLNLSQDHLDWHGSMEAYYAAKARLFTPAFTDRCVVVVDDAWGRRLADEVAAEVVTVGHEADATYRIRDVRMDADGGRATVDSPDGEVEVSTRLLGEFNVVNAVAAYAAARSAGFDAGAVRQGIAASPGVPGRLERVDAGQPFPVLVDYAHSPDAVTRVLDALRSLVGPGGRLHIVVGCGGDRDRSKRPLMGAAAAQADVAVLTSDNPRSEDPAAILAAMHEGARAAVARGAPAQLEVLEDRREAIARALTAARAGDVVVIAGKGHEVGQEFADRTEPFDDRQVARELLTRQASM